MPLIGCVTASPHPTPPPVVITSPNKCQYIPSNLLIKSQNPPSRAVQGDVTAEDKIKFLEDWLNDALSYGRKEHDQLNLLIDNNINCVKE